MPDFDVVIVGGGAAGLSAALVFSRARRKVLVVDSGAPRNAPASHMHGFLSRDGMPPAQLLAAGRDEVQRCGSQVRNCTVDELVADGQSAFKVLLSDGHRVSGRRVLVATGLRDELPDVEGLHERWARDVLHCPYCHGFEVRGQQLGVLGSSAESVHYAQIVRQWSNDVVFFAPAGVLTPGQRYKLAARGIRVVEGVVMRICVEHDRLQGVELEAGRVVPLQTLFVPPRLIPNQGLLTALGCAVDDAGWVVRDSTGRTTVPGTWVAGNVANPRAQVITAAGEGSAAAIAIDADLVEEDVRIAVREFGGFSA